MGGQKGGLVIQAENFVYYVSTQAGIGPVRTIFVCADDGAAKDAEELAQFAEHSGWREIAEEAGAVLVLPLAEGGWEAQPAGLLPDLYQETKDSFEVRDGGEALWGRNGKLWCWETLVFVVGYGTGAVFAGNSVLAHPGFAAASALCGGVPTDFSHGEERSEHLFVRKVSDDYGMRKKNVPVALGIIDVPDTDYQKVRAYFPGLRASNDYPAGLVWINFKPSSDIKKKNRVLYNMIFRNRIRWNDGPDGSLAFWEEIGDFEQNEAWINHSLWSKGEKVDYFVHLPDGKTKKEAKGLAVVFSLHGRGEPAYMFAQKQGWDFVCDEMQDFLLVVPDSPGNIWFLERDGKVFKKMIRELERTYGIDTERVFLTGFSNGAVMTREMAWYAPELFAGVAMWGGAGYDTSALQKNPDCLLQAGCSGEARALAQRFSEEGWQMPAAFFYGDNDPVAGPDTDGSLPLFLRANGCKETPDLVYDGEENRIPSRHCMQKSRFAAQVYGDVDGKERVLRVLMKNMPHGAIMDESFYCWEFLRKFRRKKGERQVRVDVARDR